MENTTNMNTPEIKVNLMNEVQGSVVSNQMLNKVDDLTEAYRQIGKLEGKLIAAESNVQDTINRTDDELNEAKDFVQITFKDNSVKRLVYHNPYDFAIEHPESIQSVKIEKANLNQLADATVKSQAIKDVEEANQKVKDAKDKMDLMERTCKRNEKRATDEVDALRKTQKETLENAVKSATAREERQNRKDIAEYKLQIDALNKENDLQVEEKENLACERDIAIEAQAKHIRLLENRLTIKNEPITNVFKAIKARMGDWYFKNRINRLSV